MINPMTLSISDGVVLRLIAEADAQYVTDAYIRNREHLRPWYPVRPEGFYTVESQSKRISGFLQNYAAGRSASFVFAQGRRVVGLLIISDIVRGAFRSANLSYWVDQEYQGRGLTSAAVSAASKVTFGDPASGGLGLHRLQAATLVHNAASQAVVIRNGFKRIGVAQKYLEISGHWQDHVPFQLLSPEGVAGESVTDAGF
ncbi:GNAT family N-acetyltransferase [Acaricomes phytoseiuli]|uniref:GNAT family N-acetyltransferase n=1 Tax=Acaricomes phytoseiuli TaxID=291968 RepID=UPI0003A91847|nr:GNAT family N-acetyltransferase [Acaricomes phytoseiuli]